MVIKAELFQRAGGKSAAMNQLTKIAQRSPRVGGAMQLHCI